MKSFAFLFVLSFLAGYLEASQGVAEETPEIRRARSAADVWERFARGVQQRHFKCKEMLEDCHGTVFDRCCDDMVCFRDAELGLTDIFDEGYCVECVDRGQICQLDKHCCGNLVCLKDHKLSVSGMCDVKLGIGEKCHFDDECESGHCHGFFYKTCED